MDIKPNPNLYEFTRVVADTFRDAKYYIFTNGHGDTLSVYYSNLNAYFNPYSITITKLSPNPQTNPNPNGKTDANKGADEDTYQATDD